MARTTAKQRSKRTRKVPAAGHIYKVLSRGGFSATTREPGSRGKGPYPTSTYEPQKASICDNERIAANAGSCPVTLGFVKGMPVIRGCFGKGKPGPTVKVRTVEEALAAADKMCRIWKQCGTFDPTKCKATRGMELAGARRR
jgi:hypothetical protein